MLRVDEVKYAPDPSVLVALMCRILINDPHMIDVENTLYEIDADGKLYQRALEVYNAACSDRDRLQDAVAPDDMAKV